MSSSDVTTDELDPVNLGESTDTLELTQTLPDEGSELDENVQNDFDYDGYYPESRYMPCSFGCMAHRIDKQCHVHVLPRFQKCAKYSPKNLFNRAKGKCIELKDKFVETKKTKIVQAAIAVTKDEILSGVTVSLAQVPEAVGFAIIAGVDPIVGLYTSAICGFFAALLGGRPGMISGAAGALAIIQRNLVDEGNEREDGKGVEYLFVASIVMGLFQIVYGIIGLGKFVHLIPKSVMIGFVNGLAIIIGAAQKTSFEDDDGDLIQGQELVYFLLLMFTSLLVTLILPTFTTVIPSAFVGIATSTLIEHGLGLDTRLVGDRASVSGAFPYPRLPDVDLDSWDTYELILMPAFSFSLIATIETMLTLQMVSDVMDSKGSQNQEMAAQGISNIISGFSGGMGGSAMIGQSVINVKSGGIRRWSGCVSGIGLLVIITTANALIEEIPLASLAGVMFVVVIKTFDWTSFGLIAKLKMGFVDIIIVVVVSVVTVFTDLSISVGIGLVIACVSFCWEQRQQLTLIGGDGVERPLRELKPSQKKQKRSKKNKRKKKQKKKARVEYDSLDTYLETSLKKFETNHSVKWYKLHGLLFFGATGTFNEFFKQGKTNDPNDIILDFADCTVIDFSGVSAIDEVALQYQRLDKRVHLVNINKKTRAIIERTGRSRLCHFTTDHDGDYNEVRSYLGVEHAVSQFSSCSKCGKPIDIKGEVRFVRRYYDDRVRFSLVDYFHFDCLMIPSKVMKKNGVLKRDIGRLLHFIRLYEDRNRHLFWGREYSAKVLRELHLINETEGINQRNSDSDSDRSEDEQQMAERLLQNKFAYNKELHFLDKYLTNDPDLQKKFNFFLSGFSQLSRREQIIVRKRLEYILLPKRQRRGATLPVWKKRGLRGRCADYGNKWGGLCFYYLMFGYCCNLTCDFCVNKNLD